MTTDPIMAEILSAVALLHGGERAKARSRFKDIWSRIAGDAQPIHACTLSHYMADVQDDPAEELAWDIRALDLALRSTDADTQRDSQAVSIAAFMPSLHVNLAEDYFKLGDFTRSRDHLASARNFLGNLPDDPYGRMIRRGIERLAMKLDTLAA